MISYGPEACAPQEREQPPFQANRRSPASTKEEWLVKILAKFLLSGVFVFLPAVGHAQDTSGLHGDCGFAPALKIYTVDRDGRVTPQTVEDLEDGQNCLNDNIQELKDKVEFIDTWGAKSDAGDIKDLWDELVQTEHDLHTAETKIETLEDRLSKAEDEIQELRLDLPIPSHRAIKKSDASKSSGLIPDTPATTPHPAIKKSDASKPKAPTSKPAAPVNKPKPAVKEGTH